MKQKSLTKKSVFLSYLLRHKPESAGLTLGQHGWVSTQALVASTDLTFDEIDQIVAEDEKGRYSINEGMIRANQGHSVSVDLQLKKAVPPVTLYHGTPLSAKDIIGKQGLLPMKRHHVHLSADKTTAEVVGVRRKGKTVIFEVDAKRMLADGFTFFISDNGVWLTDSVPPKYLHATIFP